MGRAFEFRKERKFKRWGHMAKTFTKIGKEITIAVKQGGPDVTGNPRLRALMQTARSENMPKENIERAIKRASEKDQADYKEIVLEGRAAHGIAVLLNRSSDLECQQPTITTGQLPTCVHTSPSSAARSEPLAALSTSSTTSPCSASRTTERLTSKSLNLN